MFQVFLNSLHVVDLWLHFGSHLGYVCSMLGAYLVTFGYFIYLVLMLSYLGLFSVSCSLFALIWCILNLIRTHVLLIGIDLGFTMCHLIPCFRSNKRTVQRSVASQ